MDNMNQYNHETQNQQQASEQNGYTNPYQPENQNGYTNPYQPESQNGTPAPYRVIKRGISTKGVIAIILCCAILFGGIGFGSAWYIHEAYSNAAQGEVPAAANNSGDPEADASGEPQTDLALKMAKEEEGALTLPEITEKSADSVVEITTESVQTGTMLQQYIASGAGSGVIITEDGYIITNNHVIKGATNITVTLRNGQSYPATLIGLDDQLDVALLKIEATGLSAASIGSSADLVVGQTVVAIGNPLGQLGGTVTDGIISALDRNITLDGETHNLLQTNAAVNPGNSGGGLFDAQGNLIALVVAKSSGAEGLGFAIPIDDIVEVLDDLKEHGYVTGRVSLGLSLVDINNEQTAWMYRVNELGTYIYSIIGGSSAAEAGLQPGDRLISVNGTEITCFNDLKTLLEDVSVGDELTFVVSRAGETLTLTVTAGEYKPDGLQNAASANPTSHPHTTTTTPENTL